MRQFAKRELASINKALLYSQSAQFGELSVDEADRKRAGQTLTWAKQKLEKNATAADKITGSPHNPPKADSKGRSGEGIFASLAGPISSALDFLSPPRKTDKAPVKNYTATVDIKSSPLALPGLPMANNTAGPTRNTPGPAKREPASGAASILESATQMLQGFDQKRAEKTTYDRSIPSANVMTYTPSGSGGAVEVSQLVRDTIREGKKVFLEPGQARGSAIFYTIEEGKRVPLDYTAGGTTTVSSVVDGPAVGTTHSSPVAPILRNTSGLVRTCSGGVCRLVNNGGN